MPFFVLSIFCQSHLTLIFIQITKSWRYIMDTEKYSIIFLIPWFFSVLRDIEKKNCISLERYRSLVFQHFLKISMNSHFLNHCTISCKCFYSLNGCYYLHVLVFWNYLKAGCCFKVFVFSGKEKRRYIKVIDKYEVLFFKYPALVSYSSSSSWMVYANLISLIVLCHLVCKC